MAAADSRKNLRRAGRRLRDRGGRGLAASLARRLRGLYRQQLLSALPVGREQPRFHQAAQPLFRDSLCRVQRHSAKSQHNLETVSGDAHPPVRSEPDRAGQGARLRQIHGGGFSLLSASRQLFSAAGGADDELGAGYGCARGYAKSDPSALLSYAGATGVVPRVSPEPSTDHADGKSCRSRQCLPDRFVSLCESPESRLCARDDQVLRGDWPMGVVFSPLDSHRRPPPR